MSLNSLSIFDIAFVTPHGICFQQVFILAQEPYVRNGLKEL